MMKRLAATLAFAGSFAMVPHLAHADEKAACIAAFDAGQSSRGAGKLTQALTQFAVCTRDVCPRSLQRACVEAATEANALLPSIVLSATDAAHAELTDVKVSIDGALVASVLDGRALSIDPGIHTFRFEALGVPPVERRVPVLEGQRSQPISVQLGAPPTSDSSRTLRYAGVGVGTAGVVGIVLGSIFGANAFAEYDTAKSTGLVSTFNSARSTGQSDAAISTAAFITGGVLVAAGATMLVLSAPKKGSTSAVLVPSIDGLRVVGTF